MNTATLAWLVATLLSTGNSGAPQPDTASADTDSHIVASVITERKNIGVLINLLPHECLNAAKYNRTQNVHYYLTTTFGAQVVSSLYKKAIDQLIKEQPIEVVAGYVWRIYRRDGTATYALMAEMQLLLYDTKYRGFHSEAYLNDLAYYLYNIRNNAFFNDLEPTLRRGLESAIKTLPSNLHQFYFESQFCLVNKYYNEYAYSSEFVEDGRRLIYTWLNPYVKAITPSTQYIWQKHVVDMPVDDVTIKGRANFVVSLRSRAYENYIYVDRRKENRIFGWPNGNEVDGSLWRVHFVADSLVFEQQGLYMCGSTALGYQEKRRYIDAISGDSSMRENETCRWYVQECPFQESVLGNWFGSWFP